MNIAPPFSVTGLTNSTNYFFAVTATNAGGEGPKSVEVNATPQAASLGTQPTAQEILMLELINRARFNPTAEATLFGIDLNEGLAAGTISAAQKPPLSFNTKLMASSRSHSQWMLNVNEFAHDGIGDGTTGDRMTAAGYSWLASGENISWRGSTGSINLTSNLFLQHQGLFLSAGHRENILDDINRVGFREIGIGQLGGLFTHTNGTTYNSSMITQNFGRTPGTPNFLTGVVYNDSNSNNIYDVGEGISGATVLIDGVGYPAFSTGGYSIPLINGSYDVTIAGAGLPSIVQASVTFSGSNKKLDVKVSGGVATVSSW